MVPPPGTTWWSRNWKWAVPAICVLAVCLVVLSLTGAYFFFSFLDHTIKSSGGYQEALALARGNPAAVEALGTPIKDGWFPTGHVEISGSVGTSDLAIPVSGPSGGGTLYVHATSVNGDWHFTQLVLKVKRTGEEIDLLQTGP